MQVVGSVHKYPLAAQWSRLADTRGERTEEQEHGMIEFDGGQLGVFHWTSVGYDSPLRWWRSSRFLAERGMGITVGVNLEVQEWLTLLAPGGEAPRFVTIERRWERNDGGALIAMVAHTGDADQPIVRWDNPFRPARKGHGPQWHDDEIGVAGCLLSLVNAVRDNTEPTYGPYQGRVDQELILAIRQSSAEGGAPVKLPLDPTQQTLYSSVDGGTLLGCRVHAHIVAPAQHTQQDAGSERKRLPARIGVHRFDPVDRDLPAAADNRAVARRHHVLEPVDIWAVGQLGHESTGDGRQEQGCMRTASRCGAPHAGRC